MTESCSLEEAFNLSHMFRLCFVEESSKSAFLFSVQWRCVHSSGMRSGVVLTVSFPREKFLTSGPQFSRSGAMGKSVMFICALWRVY